MSSHRSSQPPNDGEGLVACQQSVSGSEWMSLTASQSAVDVFVALPSGGHTRVSFTGQLTCHRGSERPVTQRDRPVCVHAQTTKPQRRLLMFRWSGCEAERRFTSGIVHDVCVREGAVQLT